MPVPSWYSALTLLKNTTRGTLAVLTLRGGIELGKREP